MMSQVITITIIVVLCFLTIRGIYRVNSRYRSGETLPDVKEMLYGSAFLGVIFVIILIRSIPDGNIVTSPVVITDKDTKEEYVTNLLITIEEDEDGRYYSVLGIIDTVNGKLLQTTDMDDPNYTTFEKQCTFELNDNSGRKYTCVVKYTNLPIRIVSRFRYHPILLSFFGSFFLFSVIYTVFCYKSFVKRAKLQAQDK